MCRNYFTARPLRLWIFEQGWYQLCSSQTPIRCTSWSYQAYAYSWTWSPRQHPEQPLDHRAKTIEDFVLFKRVKLCQPSPSLWPRVPAFSQQQRSAAGHCRLLPLQVHDVHNRFLDTDFGLEANIKRAQRMLATIRMPISLTPPQHPCKPWCKPPAVPQTLAAYTPNRAPKFTCKPCKLSIPQPCRGVVGMLWMLDVISVALWPHFLLCDSFIVVFSLFYVSVQLSLHGDNGVRHREPPNDNVYFQTLSENWLPNANIPKMVLCPSFSLFKITTTMINTFLTDKSAPTVSICLAFCSTKINSHLSLRSNQNYFSARL
jgi:hypothetical protein